MNSLKKIYEKINAKIYCMLLPRKTSTSISDNQSYPQICLDAANNFKYFNVFRKNPVYAAIVETVTEDLGKEYLKLLSKDAKAMQNMEEIKKNDNWGGPTTYNYQGVGNISPTTLRYLKVASDLKKYFKNPEGCKVCEIGIGYGGQCRIIDTISAPKSYCLVDIQPALQLTHRYLGNYNMNAVLSFKTMNELDYNDYDLCISNYAFSELPRELQNTYLKKVILRSKMGYITYSDGFTPSSFNSYRVDELLRIIPGALKINEEPKTGPNFIILWGIKE